MYNTLYFCTEDVLRLSHALASVPTGSHKAKNKAAEHWACVSKVPNCKSPVKALSKQESGENALAAWKSKAQLLNTSARGEQILLTLSLLQSFVKLRSYS